MRCERQLQLVMNSNAAVWHVRKITFKVPVRCIRALQGPFSHHASHGLSLLCVAGTGMQRQIQLTGLSCDC